MSFPISGGVDAIVKHIECLVYDGGTNLSQLSAPREPQHLVGEKRAQRSRRLRLLAPLYRRPGQPRPRDAGKLEAPVYPISNDARSNHALLKRIAAASGGVYFNLERVTDDQVTAGLAKTPYSLTSVECNPAEVADVYPHGSQPVLGRVTVTGKLLAPEAKIKLNYGFGGSVVASQEFTLTQKGATATGLVPRYWAQQKVAELSSDVEANNDALAAVGREFNLVTPNTSLLVLETVEQYLQYKIVPPKTSGAIYAQFMTQIEQQKQQLTQTREERINSVLALWKQRVEWWNGEYKYAKEFKYTEPAGATGPGLAVPPAAAPPAT